MKNQSYRDPTLKFLNSQTYCIPSDVVNLHDEHPTIIFCPKSLDKYDDKSYFPPPFFLTLTIHDKMLHNYILDSSTFHNLMPKVVIESLGLSINKPCHDLYAFDSRAAKCLGVVKDLVVSLT